MKVKKLKQPCTRKAIVYEKNHGFSSREMASDSYDCWVGDLAQPFGVSSGCKQHSQLDFIDRILGSSSLHCPLNRPSTDLFSGIGLVDRRRLGVWCLAGDSLHHYRCHARGTAVFLRRKKLGKSLVKKQWSGNAAKIQGQMEQNGFFYVLLFRLIPVINFDLISYLAAFAKVRFSSFALATLIGIIPGTFAYNFLGSSFVSGNPKIISMAVVVFIVLTFVPILVRNRWMKKQKLI
ncbi:TVP38/TMEM64 family protein [Planococcus antarcticus]